MVIDDKKNAVKRYHQETRSKNSGVKSSSIWLLIVGMASLVIWYLTNDGSMMSMLIALASISTITFSVLLYFLSPAKVIRSDVCDAMVVTETFEIRRLLSFLHIESKGIYMPTVNSGSPGIFLPLTNDLSSRILPSNTIDTVDNTCITLNNGKNGIILSPPGYGIFQYYQHIGGSITSDGIANEISDAIENSLELADKVSVNIHKDQVKVTMRNIVNHELCTSIRREDPAICVQTGCPVCSAVGCMIVSGMNRMAYVERVSVDGTTVEIVFRLIGE